VRAINRKNPEWTEAAESDYDDEGDEELMQPLSRISARIRNGIC
jgi:hypothetical protein